MDHLSNNETAFAYFQRLERVFRFVEQNYREPIRLADAAQGAGRERTAVSHFFRRKTGMRYRDWLAAFRVDMAKELMSESNRSVREIADMVGYRNVRSFRRTFQRFAGRSPIEYKNAVRPS